MELVVLAIPYLATISSDILKKTIETSVSSLTLLSKHIFSLNKYQYKQLKIELESIDIYNSANIINSLIKEQLTHEDIQDSVKSAILGVNEILQKIIDEMNIIKNAISIHESKYLNQWRQFDCSVNIETIKRNESILYKRYKLLKDIIIINKSCAL